MTAELTRNLATSDAPYASAETAHERAMRRALTATIALLLVLQLHLAVVMAVNWDEFHFLTQVHEFARGELVLAVNTFHVHLFQWLPLIPGGEINQIVAARLVMLALEMGTVLAIVSIAERFVPRWAALAGAVAYLSYGNVLLYAPSFRTDPLATFLMMSTLCLVVRSDLRRRHAIVIGVFVALAGLVTIKSVFYLPSLALGVWWRWRLAPDSGRILNAGIIAAVVGAAMFGSLFWLHSSGLATVDSSVETTSSAYKKMLQTGILFPQWQVFQHDVRTNILHWVVISIGLAATIAGALRNDKERAQWVVVGGLALPLATLALYQNAFPYFYGFILAPAAVVAAVAFSARLKRWPMGAALLAGMVASAGLHYAVYVRHGQDVQRAVVETVHKMFPSPVPYVEKADMIASFPEVGVHMTDWGMANYRQVGRPVFTTAAPERRPVFVIVGNIVLGWALRGEELGSPYGLLPQDAAFLHRNFIPHWGPIWVAGKRLHLNSADQRVGIEIPGRYTLEANQPVAIDGAAVKPGQPVELAVGLHVIGGATGDVTLRWGEGLYRPSQPVPAGQIYWPF